MSEESQNGYGKERSVTLEPYQEIIVQRASSKDGARLPSANNFNFKNTHLSKNHAVVRYADGKFQIRDLGSTFGTVVNGNYVVAGEDNWINLEDGDTLGFILFKPSSFISSVREKEDPTISLISLTKFKSPSIGIEFKVAIKDRSIRLDPITVSIDEESDEDAEAKTPDPDLSITAIDVSTDNECNNTHSMQGCHSLMAERLKNLDVTSGLPKVGRVVLLNDDDEEEHDEDYVEGKSVDLSSDRIDNDDWEAKLYSEEDDVSREEDDVDYFEGPYDDDARNREDDEDASFYVESPETLAIVCPKSNLLSVLNNGLVFEDDDSLESTELSDNCSSDAGEVSVLTQVYDCDTCSSDVSDPEYTESRKRRYDELEDSSESEDESDEDYEPQPKRSRWTVGGVLRRGLKEAAIFALYSGITIAGLVAYGNKLEDQRQSNGFGLSRFFTRS